MLRQAKRLPARARQLLDDFGTLYSDGDIDAATLHRLTNRVHKAGPDGLRAIEVLKNCCSHPKHAARSYARLFHMETEEKKLYWLKVPLKDVRGET